MQILISFLNFLSIFLIIFIGLFIFWGNMYRQGFRNEKIWNFVAVLSAISLILGKVLYIVSSSVSVDLSFGTLVSPPYLIGGIIVGAVFVTSVISSANNWSVFRAGDYVALSLNFFLLSFGLHRTIFLFVATNKLNFIDTGIVLLYLALYIFLTRSLRTQVFSGYIFTVFLIVVSIIESAGLFLLTYTLQFSHTIYFAIIIFAVINLFERYKEIKIMQTNLPEDFIDEMKVRLEEKQKEISEDLGDLNEADSFVKDETRVEHNAEPAEEAQEIEEHYDNVANRGVLLKIKEQINKALGRIKKGNYGEDENTEKPISKERLEADPSATTNVEQEK